MSQQTVIADRFKLESLLGHGGMGEVYRAIDQHTGQVVAVKRLKRELTASNPTLVERFAREAEVLEQLNHPNIVGMLCTLEIDGEHYLVMEYIGGGSLADVLEDRSQLPIKRTLKIGLDLADALTRAHRINVIHRDLKPGNVLLDEEGVPHLTDFGAAHVQHTRRLTQTGMVLGTYAYMSPEACNGDPVDARTDIWSFGVMLYEMLAGQQPFSHPKLMHLLMSIMTEPPPDLQQLRPEVSDRLADLIYRMLAKDRDQRIPNTRLVGIELEAVMQGQDLKVQEPASRTYTSGRFARPTVEAEAPRYNLPLIATPFVGREEELAEINRLIADSSSRLLTIHGPGGIGKTRLALQAALEHLQDFQHGVYFVDLAAVEEADLIIPAVADAVQFNFFGSDEPEVQLLNYLQSKEMLLVLDNFEHLTEEGVPLLPRILQAAPQVNLLVTSRERLNLREEWLLPLRGLPVPEAVVEDGDTAATSIRLFVQSARRVRPNFRSDVDSLRAIHRICQLVDGLPLGIELAAAWTNVLDPAEIAEQISQDFDFLVTNLRDLPLRHRSVRSVFEYSWNLLKQEEKEALCRLSAFRGGFDRQAARQVVDASLLTLNTLMNKSLLRRHPASGRYEMQELLRQFAGEKLAEIPGEEKDATERHARYYLHYLRQRTDDLIGGRQLEALEEIDHEMGNVRTAWNWAVEQRDAKAIDLGLDALYYFYQLRGRQQEGAEAFAQAARALRGRVEEPNLVLAKVIARQGAYSRFIGRLDEAKALLQGSLEMARALDEKREIAFSLYNLGAADPDHAGAEKHWKESLSLAEEIGDRTLIAEALNWLAFAAYDQGDYVGAIQRLERALDVRRAVEDKRGLANALTNLGLIHIHLGMYDRAQGLLQEGLQICRQINDLHGLATAYNNLSYTAINTENYEIAQQWGQHALEYYKEVGDKRGEGLALGNLSQIAFYLRDYERSRAISQQCIALYKRIGLSTSSYHNDLGRIALAQEKYEEARQAFHKALQEEPNPSLALDILVGLATVMVDTEQAERAVALLNFVQQHPAGEQLVKERAATQLAKLEETFPPEQFATARDVQRTLAEWVEWVQQNQPALAEGRDI